MEDNLVSVLCSTQCDPSLKNPARFPWWRGESHCGSKEKFYNKKNYGIERFPRYAETYAWKKRNLLPLHKPQLLLHFSFILSPELHWFDKAHDGHLGSESVQSVNVSKQPGVFNLAEKLNYLTSNQSLNIIMSFHEWLHFLRGSGI